MDRPLLLRKLFVERLTPFSELRSAAVRDYAYKYLFTSNATSKETSTERFRKWTQSPDR